MMLKEFNLLTSNRHKYEEFSSFFSPAGITITHIPYKYTELQADTIEEIALSSASNLLTIREDNFVLEDSGIFIDDLKGFPGPYSAYIFQTVGWEGILRLLNKTQATPRTATFVSVIALAHNNTISLFKGECKGLISGEGKGTDGFGFDPIFIPLAAQANKLMSESEMVFSGKTFAELAMDEKNQISHRAFSMHKLLEYLQL